MVKDRQGNIVLQDEGQNKMLSYLYHTRAGRAALSVLIQPWVSHLAGAFLDTRWSLGLIKPFVSKNKIDMSQYEEEPYTSYNAFFTRKIKEGCRKIDMDAKHLIAPCDSKLTVYPITPKARFCVKDSWYSMESLTRSGKLAKKYEGGLLLVFRLTVDDYHRYCYPDTGYKSGNRRILGVFHTVNPIASEVYPIYKENTREYTLLRSENFGTMLMMEVGALLVGRIVNHHESCKVVRGEEKGMFEFGGSTVILCLQKDCAVMDADIMKHSADNIETVVKMGERIGIAKHKII